MFDHHVAVSRRLDPNPKEELNKAARNLENAETAMLEASPATKKKAEADFNTAFKSLQSQAKSYATLNPGNENLDAVADKSIDAYRKYLVESQKPAAKQDPAKRESYIESAHELIKATDLAIKGKGSIAAAAAASAPQGAVDLKNARSIIDGIVQPKDLEPNAKAYGQLLEKAVALEALSQRAQGSGAMADKLTSTEKKSARESLNAELPKDASSEQIKEHSNKLLEKMSSSLSSLAGAKDKRGAEFADAKKLNARIDAETSDGRSDQATDLLKKGVKGIFKKKIGMHD